MNAIQALERLALVPGAKRAGHVRPVRSLAPRAILFHEGDTAGHLYEVVSGILRLTRLLETGRRQVVAFAHPGDIVGFPAAGSHHVNCEALTDVTVIAYHLSALDDVDRDSDLHRKLRTAAFAEIAALQDHLLLLARKGATGKMASFLGDLADRKGIPSPDGIRLDMKIPRSDIADYLCLTIETVSRTLTRMCEDGLIARDGTSRLRVIDLDGLAAMACSD